MFLNGVFKTQFGRLWFFIFYAATIPYWACFDALSGMEQPSTAYQYIFRCQEGSYPHSAQSAQYREMRGKSAFDEGLANS